jgi:predicted phosphoribosyltransferase
MLFKDRQHAGQLLARQLEHYRGRPELLVLALPRGGVPVAFEVAQALGARLDVLTVRKLGMPGYEEYAVGAIAEGGILVRNVEMAGQALAPDALNAVITREQAELARRSQIYRGGRAPLSLENRNIILIDDGMATGSTMRAAVLAVRQKKPARIVVAVPVAPPEVCESFRDEIDEFICALMPDSFHAVGRWYEDFRQTSDAQVQALLEKAGQPGV